MKQEGNPANDTREILIAEWVSEKVNEKRVKEIQRKLKKMFKEKKIKVE